MTDLGTPKPRNFFYPQLKITLYRELANIKKKELMNMSNFLFQSSLFQIVFLESLFSVQFKCFLFGPYILLLNMSKLFSWLSVPESVLLTRLRKWPKPPRKGFGYKPLIIVSSKSCLTLKLPGILIKFTANSRPTRKLF